MENYFTVLNNINVNEHTESKNGLTYLSWAWAWGEVKKVHPDANYTIYENKDGWNYFTDGHTGWVKTGVTINGIEHIEYLPIMDYRNKSIPVEGITSFDVNKSIQRSLTKACARHGLGLYIYAGEDLPEDESTKDLDNKIKSEKAKATRELNKKVNEYYKTDDGLKLRYDTIYSKVKSMREIDQYKKDVILVEEVNKMLQEVKEAGKENAYNNLYNLLNEKMLKEEPDSIPENILEKDIKPEEYLQSG